MAAGVSGVWGDLPGGPNVTAVQPGAVKEDSEDRTAVDLNLSPGAISVSLQGLNEGGGKGSTSVRGVSCNIGSMAAKLLLARCRRTPPPLSGGLRHQSGTNEPLCSCPASWGNYTLKCMIINSL